MEYKGQLSTQDKEAMIGEEDESIESLLDVPNTQGPRVRINEKGRPSVDQRGNLGVDRVGSMIYQSRSLFARNSSIHHMAKGALKQEKITKATPSRFVV